MNARAINPSDLNELKPKYVLVPTEWQPSGAQGFISKQGKPYTLIKFIRPDNSEVRFFMDRMAKDDTGAWLVELAHYNTQLQRAEEWVKKGGKV